MQSVSELITEGYFTGMNTVVLDGDLHHYAIWKDLARIDDVDKWPLQLQIGRKPWRPSIKFRVENLKIEIRSK
jgi:hypothetical protein